MDRGRDWDAEDYLAHSEAQQEWARELVAKLHLGGDERLLDVGCGDGRSAALLAERLPRGAVVGIDASPSMIRMAATRFPPTRHPNLSFRQMDARHIELPFTFDVVFSTAVLHWIRDHLAVLRGVRACMRPGGRLLFQMGGQGNIAEALRVAGAVMARPRWAPWFEGFALPYFFYGPEDYATWLPQADFQLVRAELFSRDMNHRGSAGLLGWLRTTWFPFTDRLPEELREPFLREVMTDYLAAYPPDEADVVHVESVRLEVEAIAT